REHVAEHRDDARREQIVQDVDVGGHPGHQTADRIAVVEPQVQALQVAVNGHLQVEHDALAGELHRPGLDVFGGKRGHQDGQIEQRDPVEPIEAAGGDVAVDSYLDEV